MGSFLHHAALFIFAHAERAERSKTLFYVLGPVFPAWAIVVSVLGFRKAEFPGGQTGQRVVCTVSVLLALTVMALAVATSARV